MSPVAKRVFFTLCQWRSTIPQLAVEAVLLRHSDDEKMDIAILHKLQTVEEAEPSISENVNSGLNQDADDTEKEIEIFIFDSDS